jgi:ADP-ribose pyrophosphatase
MTEDGGSAQGEAGFGRDAVELIDAHTAFDGFWKLKVLRLRHRRFAGGWSAEIRREVHCRGEAVGVLLYDPALDAIGLVEQFRSGAWARGIGSPWLIELVAGLREDGEEPAQVAMRETLEEAGREVQALRHIASYYSSPGGCDEYFHLYCARVSLASGGTLHGEEAEHEDIRLQVFSYVQALEQLAAGRFDNAHTVVALQWLVMHRDEVRAAWI